MTVPIFNEDIDRNIQKYREIDDVYFEKSLISVLILSCGNYIVVKNCLKKLFDGLNDCSINLEFIFLEQGWSLGKDAGKNVEYFTFLCDKYNIERKLLILPSQNGGINYGVNQLWRSSRGEYCLFLENDWYLLRDDYQWLLKAKRILDDCSEIGIVQLRNVFDPNENWGLGKQEYNPFSIKNNPNVITRKIDDDYFYLALNKIYGVNNNPALWRKTMRNELGNMKEAEPWSDLKHGETEYQERFVKTNWKTAHIGMPVFCHAGNPLFERQWMMNERENSTNN